MATEVQFVNSRPIPMYDQDRNRYLVHIKTKQIRTTFNEDSSSGWIDDSKTYECDEGQITPQDDGSFLIVSLDRRIYPKSRLPGKSGQ